MTLWARKKRPDPTRIIHRLPFIKLINPTWHQQRRSRCDNPFIFIHGNSLQGWDNTFHNYTGYLHLPDKNPWIPSALSSYYFSYVWPTCLQTSDWSRPRENVQTLMNHHPLSITSKNHSQITYSTMCPERSRIENSHEFNYIIMWKNGLLSP